MSGVLGGFALRPNMRVGVLGGSFDPAHEGHAEISREALRRFDLDRVVWLVSPGNPLKANAPAPLQQRLGQARSVAGHPRIGVSDFETRENTLFTSDTLQRLKSRFREVNFVWLMGADNLVQFHRWDNWQDILAMVPVGVLARPGQRIPARMSVTARKYRHAFLPEAQSRRLAVSAPPAWCFVNIPMNPISSTALREARRTSPGAENEKAGV